MKMLNKFFCIVLCLCITASATVFASASTGTVYYVDSIAGDDSNSGLSPDKAFKTIEKAASILYYGGDSVLFKAGGVYIGNFGVMGTSDASNPITIGSYGEGAKPLFTSSKENDPVIALYDASGWIIENIEITAPKGTGILVYYRNSCVKDVVIRNVTLHDIQNYPSDNYFSSSRAAIRLMGSPVTPGAHLENITVDGCEIYDCGYGIFTGSNYPNTPETPYNKNIIVENCSIHDLWDDAFIMSDTDTIILRNSSIINTCQSSGVYYTAPVWMWGVTNGLVENCEIAGAKNVLDGMAVDFDDHTDHSTFQYIYSHDNVRFMWNCPVHDDHYGNTVRYCLSVNDNITSNGSGNGNETAEHDFKFYNNTIVNGSTYNFYMYDDAVIKNNIFILEPGYLMKFNRKYDYDMSNNCYWGVTKPINDKNSFIALPQFAGKDLTDKNSFILKACSPCIGAGVQVEENMGEHDFFGNSLDSTHNIGCYEGDGVEGEKESPTICDILVSMFIAISRLISDLFD